MPKDFDIDRRRRLASDRDFIVGGETFRYTTEVAPEVIFPYMNMQGDGVSGEDAMRIVDEMVTSLIVPVHPGDDPAARWVALRAQRGEEAVGMPTLLELTAWLAEQVTASPLGEEVEPPISAPGSTTPTAGTASTDGSLLEAVAALPPSTPEAPSTPAPPITSEV